MCTIYLFMVVSLSDISPRNQSRHISEDIPRCMIEDFLSSRGIDLEKLKYLGFGIAAGIFAMIATIVGLSVSICYLKSKYKRKKARVENMSVDLYSEKRYAEFLEFQRRYDQSTQVMSQMSPQVSPPVTNCTQPTEHKDDTTPVNQLDSTVNAPSNQLDPTPDQSVEPSGKQSRKRKKKSSKANIPEPLEP